jgi:hypothetical protein
MKCVPALLLLVACGPSPQPLPPPEIVRQGLSVTEAEPDVLEVRGDVGAVTNEADRIELVGVANLAVVNVAVAADGSFVATLPASLTDAVRLQAFADALRSTPIDVIADPASPVGAVMDAPRIACAVLEPSIALDLPDTLVGQPTSAEVIVRSECSGILSVDEAVLQTDPTWEVLASVPVDMMPGDQTSITVLRNPPAPGEARNYLRLRLADGVQPELRLVTVHVIAR